MTGAGVGTGTLAGAAPISPRPISTRSLTSRQTETSLRPSVRPMTPTVVPLPIVTMVRHRSRSITTSGPGQIGRERDPGVHRRHDGLDLAPFDQQVLGLDEQRLDIARRARVGRRRAGLERERAVVVAQQLEEDVDRRRRLLQPGRLCGHDATGVDPDTAGAAVAAHPEPSGLPRRSEEAEDIGKRKGVEGALQGHGDLRVACRVPSCQFGFGTTSATRRSFFSPIVRGPASAPWAAASIASTGGSRPVHSRTACAAW